MAKNISLFANSDYGIGITGKLNRMDCNNPYGKDNIVYISIYDRNMDIYSEFSIEVIEASRRENKGFVIDKIIIEFMNLLNIDEKIAK